MSCVLNIPTPRDIYPEDAEEGHVYLHEGRVYLCVQYDDRNGFVCLDSDSAWVVFPFARHEFLRPLGPLEVQRV